MNNENVYLNALKDILVNGEKRNTRNSITISKFGIKMDFDIRHSFPLLTTKKVYWKGVVHELLWFIKGDTNSKNLEYNNVIVVQYMVFNGDTLEPIIKIFIIIITVKG
jgi:thymidylate synthase